MKNHTCSHHIRRDAKSKLKGHEFEKGTNCTQAFVSQSLETSQPMLWIWVEVEYCLWGFTIISKPENKLWDFFVKNCEINLQTYEKSPQYYTCTTLHLCEIA
jgi:hypothetical protein